MIKNITTLVTTNRKAIVKKLLVVGGVTLGLVAGTLLAGKPEDAVLVGETVEDDTLSPEAPATIN